MNRNKDWKVTSLELSKQIDVEHKRLGIEVESEWVWIEEERGIRLATFQDFLQQSVINPKLYPAYDTAELGEVIARAGWDYCEAIYYVIELKQWQYRGVRYYSEAKAKGQKYLYLLKNGHIKGVELL